MINGLSTLADLTFNCWNQFLLTILDALHSNHPSCRIYLHTFRLSGLCGWDAPRLSLQNGFCSLIQVLYGGSHGHGNESGT
jgi:hypothetical protein